jgi:hypothetical protein
MATISDIAPQVIARLEETNPPVFWQLNTEIYSGIVEGINDLLLLVGRPTNTVNLPVTLLPNTIWQPMPPGMFCITDIQGPGSAAWKMTMFDMDYTQSSWQSSWENDLSDSFQRWFPVGLTSFGIHPAVSVPQPVTITGIQLVTTEAWPYDGTVVFPFHDEFIAAVEKYAASYCRLKEGGNEFFESLALYQEYLGDAERLTEIEDRRDPYIFGRNLGVQAGVKQTSQR